jgi:hypothetical protein
MAAAAAALVFVGVDHWRDPSLNADFDQWWYAALAIRRGLDPYVVVGPGGALHATLWPFYYPLTTALVVLPLSYMPLLAARCVFVGLSAALFGYAITEEGFWPLILLTSGSFVEAARLGQWSILFAAALFLSPLTILTPAKPSTGLVAFIGARRRLIVATTIAWVILLAVSVAVQPSWIGEWLRALRAAPHVRSLIFTPSGWILLGALVIWRRPEGQLLLAYAVIPHTPAAYDGLPALTVGRTRSDYLLLASGSLVALAIQAIVIWPNDPRMVSPWLAVSTVAGIYLPALAISIRASQRS